MHRSGLGSCTLQRDCGSNDIAFEPTDHIQSSLFCFVSLCKIYLICGFAVELAGNKHVNTVACFEAIMVPASLIVLLFLLPSASQFSASIREWRLGLDFKVYSLQINQRKMQFLKTSISLNACNYDHVCIFMI